MIKTVSAVIGFCGSLDKGKLGNASKRWYLNSALKSKEESTRLEGQAGNVERFSRQVKWQVQWLRAQELRSMSGQQEKLCEEEPAYVQSRGGSP